MLELWVAIRREMGGNLESGWLPIEIGGYINRDGWLPIEMGG